MKLKVDKRKALFAGIAVSISLAVIFGLYSGVAYSRTPVTTRATYRTLYVEEGHLEHSGVFSNQTIYRDGTSLRYYPTRITEAITGNYTFRTSPGAAGSYDVVLHVRYYVSTGGKKVYILNESSILGKGMFSGSFTVPVNFNMTDINSRLRRVREGTGLYRAEGEVYVTVKVRTNGREVFTQEIRLNRDASGMMYVTGTDKEYRKVVRNVSTTENSLSFAGSDVGVSTARTLFPAMALLFAIPPAGALYAKREKKTDGIRSLRKYVVEGTQPRGKRVELSSARDLEKAFELVDRPIVHYRDGDTDVYAIADGETVYEYRAN